MVARSPLGLTYALVHLASARTMGVHCAMKCLARPSAREARLRKDFFACNRTPPPRSHFVCPCHRLTAIKVNTWRFGHHSGAHLPSFILLGTHNGYPLCYETPRSSLHRNTTASPALITLGETSTNPPFDKGGKRSVRNVAKELTKKK